MKHIELESFIFFVVLVITLVYSQYSQGSTHRKLDEQYLIDSLVILQQRNVL